MTLLLQMIPVYLVGNLHCLGMCGPIVMLLGQHPYRHAYFLGRTTSFSLMGGAAGLVGAGLNRFLDLYQLPAITSFLFGAVILLIGIQQLSGLSIGFKNPIGRLTSRIESRLSILMLQERFMPAFLFGFFTVLLPCGQLLIVFSASATMGSASLGWLNGFVFALLTSPSLWLAMRASRWLKQLKSYHRISLGVLAIAAGLMVAYRGLAVLELAPPPCEHCAHRSGSELAER